MMNILAVYVPAAFPALALAHFFALLSPGPDFFLIVGHAARHRLRGTWGICAGIAVGNALYIALAISGWSVLREAPLLYRGLEWCGAGYLCWLGSRLIRASRLPVPLHGGQMAVLPAGRQLLTGLASALLNPKNAVFYLTLMTVIIGPVATLRQQIFSGTWMCTLVLLWDCALAALISRPWAQRALRRRIPLIEFLAGSILLLLAVSMLAVSFFSESFPD